MMRGEGLSRARRVSALLAAIAVTVPPVAFAGGVASMVADVEQSTPGFGAVGAARLERIEDGLFFAGRDAEHGQEPWLSNGSAEGTLLVADIRPGPIGSFPGRPTQVGGITYFAADDGEHGEELWATNGTAAGTHMVADIFTGPEASRPRNLVASGGLLYFTASSPTTGNEIWRTDGTEEGTILLADVMPGDAGSNPQNLTPFEGGILFAAGDLEHGFEPWRSNGTPEGTDLVADVYPGPLSMFGATWAHKGAFPVLDGKAYFPADDGEHGFELWRTDGTPEGTELFADLITGDGSSYPAPRLVVDGHLLFTTSVDFGAAHLWQTDGSESGTEEIAEVGPQRFEAIAEADGTVFFVANTTQLWKTDRTPEGTEMLHDISTPACAPQHYFGRFATMGSRLFLVGRAAGRDEELWTSDGTPEGTERVADIRPFGGSEPRSLRVLGDHVYFIADDGTHGRELWRSDGTEQNTSMVVDLALSTDDFFTSGFRFAELGGKVYFADADSRGLWRSDGTAAGTEVVPGTASLVMPFWTRRPDPVLVPADDQLFFWARAGASGLDLWRTDGTAAGTRRIAAAFGSTCGEGEEIAIGDTLYFGGCGTGTNLELWKSDGNTASLVREIRAGNASSVPRALTALGNAFFFFADDGVHGRELWRSDGTALGTNLVKDIRPGSNAGAGFDLPSIFGIDDKRRASILAGKGVVYFVGNDGPHGKELWKSDGTEAGTVMVKDIIPGTVGGLGIAPTADGLGAWAVTEDGTLYFLRFALLKGWELWKSDGTEDGTVFIADVATENVFLDDLRMFALGNKVYFTGQAGPFELILWRSDGTPAGTDPFPEVVSTRSLAHAAGALYFSDFGFREPMDLRVIDQEVNHSASIGEVVGEGTGIATSTIFSVGGRRFFVANDGIHGGELWTSSCGDGVVEANEQCDDGAANGHPGSCCTRGCEVRTTPNSDVDGDHTIDWCDTQEGSLNLRIAAAQRRPRTPRADARILVDGSFAAAPAGFDPMQGFEIRVSDANALAVSARVSGADCEARGSSRFRCRSKDGSIDVRFRREGGNVEFRFEQSGLEMEEGLEGPITVTLTQGAVIDRVGVSGPCRGNADRLSCRP